jgi:hypothetical protein
MTTTLTNTFRCSHVRCHQTLHHSLLWTYARLLTLNSAPLANPTEMGQIGCVRRPADVDQKSIWSTDWTNWSKPVMLSLPYKEDRGS